MQSSPQQAFEALNLTLPPAPTPKGVYKPALIVGNFIYVSGHGPYLPDGGLMTGRSMGVANFLRRFGEQKMVLV